MVSRTGIELLEATLYNWAMSQDTANAEMDCGTNDSRTHEVFNQPPPFQDINPWQLDARRTCRDQP